MPELVLPRLRGTFGRDYLHASRPPSTQRCRRRRRRTARSRSPSTRPQGRGRLGRVWVDEAGTGLAFSVVLRPPPPVARWPELTLVAAEAVAGAIGDGRDDQAPERRAVGGRKVAGILAEAGDHVVLGIGVNVGKPPWPGAGSVDRDRLELLVEILERLERGYDRWAAPSG